MNDRPIPDVPAPGTHDSEGACSLRSEAQALTCLQRALSGPTADHLLALETRHGRFPGTEGQLEMQPSVLIGSRNPVECCAGGSRGKQWLEDPVPGEVTDYDDGDSRSGCRRANDRWRVGHHGAGSGIGEPLRQAIARRLEAVGKQRIRGNRSSRVDREGTTLQHPGLERLDAMLPGSAELDFQHMTRQVGPELDFEPRVEPPEGIRERA